VFSNIFIPIAVIMLVRPASGKTQAGCPEWLKCKSDNQCVVRCQCSGENAINKSSSVEIDEDCNKAAVCHKEAVAWFIVNKCTEQMPDKH